MIRNYSSRVGTEETKLIFLNNPMYYYDKLWASVMKAVPKLDESESGQMVLK